MAAIMNEQIQRLWDAIGACNRQMWELRKDMDRISNMRHDVSTQGIEETQEAVAELGVIVLGDGEIPEDESGEGAADGGESTDGGEATEGEQQQSEDGGAE